MSSFPKNSSFLFSSNHIISQTLNPDTHFCMCTSAFPNRIYVISSLQPTRCHEKDVAVMLQVIKAERGASGGTPNHIYTPSLRSFHQQETKKKFQLGQRSIWSMQQWIAASARQRRIYSAEFSTRIKLCTYISLYLSILFSQTPNSKVGGEKQGPGTEERAFNLIPWAA